MSFLEFKTGNLGIDQFSRKLFFGFYVYCCYKIINIGRYWLFMFFKTIQISFNSIPRHFFRFFKIFPISNTARQTWNNHSKASFCFRPKYYFILYYEQEMEENLQKKGSAVFDFIKFIFIVAVIVIPVRFWVAQPFLVNGASMEPTYHNGDYLIVDEISYRVSDPKKDDVIIFRYPKNPKVFFIKRIIALPNEEIILDGKEIRLKNDEYFVMGDNRDASSDSRIWGPVPKKLIIGRSIVRLWPLNKIGLFPGY